MCDTVVVVEPDRVLFAKNSDRDPNEAQILEWHAAADHRTGESLRATHIEIPQVPHTHAILISRPFWMWGAEMGTNEHGVTIGNEAVFTDQPYAVNGLTGMDLLRLALERAASAAEAAETITTLLGRHGQGGRCGLESLRFTYHNSFLIADPSGAIVLETAGREWASERVGNGVRSISNGLSIPGFAERHRDRIRGAVSRCETRRRLTADGARADLAALMALLRSHGDGRWPRYSAVSGAMSAPCMHAGGLITSSQTTASWVSELRRGAHGHWATATAAPCLSLFKPVAVETPLAAGAALPIDWDDGVSLWWRHERLHRSVLRDPGRAAVHLGERDALEQSWLADPPGSAAAFSAHGTLLDRWLADLEPPADRRPIWVRRYWAARDRAAGLSLSQSPVPA